ncbi:hypothetical protein [Rubeoparvulum massiliense]|uniref:hypothetical protein n=1 Tax=Rubeoparvulum massiliense TaxID=1631346 RepID=UPI00065DF45B|nr:hypothetical protein [Rubeoparvulum massiliense]
MAWGKRLTVILLSSAMIATTSPILAMAEATNTGQSKQVEVKQGVTTPQVVLPANVQNWVSNGIPLLKTGTSQLIVPGTGLQYRLGEIERKEWNGKSYITARIHVKNSTGHTQRIKTIALDFITKQGVRYRMPLTEPTMDAGLLPGEEKYFHFSGVIADQAQMNGAYILVYHEDLKVYPKKEVPYSIYSIGSTTHTYQQVLAPKQEKLAEPFILATVNQQLEWQVKSIWVESSNNQPKLHVKVDLTNKHGAETTLQLPALRWESGSNHSLLLSDQEQGGQPLHFSGFEQKTLFFQGDIESLNLSNEHQLTVVDRAPNTPVPFQHPWVAIPIPGTLITSHGEINWKQFALDHHVLTATSWGEAFQLPTISKTLRFQPVSFETQYNNGFPQLVLKMKVTNEGIQNQVMPQLGMRLYYNANALDGQTLPPSKTSLTPKDSGYLYFAIAPNEELYQDGQPDYLLIYQAKNQSLPQNDELIFVSLTGSGLTATTTALATESTKENKNAGKTYPFGTPIRLDHFSLLPSSVEVALMSLQKGESDVEGMDGWIAKLELNNKAKGNVRIPQFASQFETSDGTQFNGISGAATLPTATPSQIYPNQKQVITFSFLVPKDYSPIQWLKIGTPIGETSLVDQQAKFVVAEGKAPNVGLFYPYSLDLKYKSSTTVEDPTKGQSIRTLHLTFEKKNVPMTRDDMSVQLEVELVDRNGTILGNQIMPVGGNGMNSVKNGKNVFTFTYDDRGVLIPISVKLYERVGDARILWKEYNLY